jgi:hypothetical protein
LLYHAYTYLYENNLLSYKICLIFCQIRGNKMAYFVYE